MRRRRELATPAAVALIGFLALAGGEAGCSRCRSGGVKASAADGSRVTPATTPLEATEAEPTGDPIPLPPTPDIALDVNSESELKVYQGTPLIVTVRLANQRASNVLFQNAAGGGVGRAPTPQPVPVVQFASEWSRSVRFEVRAGEDVRPLGWPLAAIGAPPAAPISLDGITNPEAQWGLSPEAAGDLAPGVYRIVAVLEVAGKDAGAWQGRVESLPVVLTVQARPASLQGPDAVESDLDLARYWALMQEWDKSLGAARKAVQDDPGSIEGHTLIGDALLARKDPGGALAAYRTALNLHDQTYKGKQYEAPEYLIGRMSQIMRAHPPKDLAP